MADRIQLRRDTAANWTNYNPILLEGEPGIELDTDQWKLGDGIHNWNDLPYRGGECVQQPGDSTTIAMSQKASTKWFATNDKVILRDEIDEDLAIKAYISNNTGRIIVNSNDRYRLVKLHLKAGTYFLHTCYNPGYTQSLFWKYTDDTYETPEEEIIGHVENTDYKTTLTLSDGYYAVAWTSSAVDTKYAAVPIELIRTGVIKTSFIGDEQVTFDKLHLNARVNVHQNGDIPQNSELTRGDNVLATIAQRNNVLLFNEINIDISLKGYININNGNIVINNDTYRFAKVYLKAGTYLLNTYYNGTQAILWKYTDNTYETPEEEIIGNPSSNVGLLNTLVTLENDGYYAVAWTSVGTAVNNSVVDIYLCKSSCVDSSLLSGIKDFTNLIIGKTIINGSDFIVGGYVSTNGNINLDNQEWEYSEKYYDVIPGSILVLENMLDSGGGVTVAFYDKNHKYLYGHRYLEDNDFNTRYIKVVEGAIYARFSRLISANSIPRVYSIGNWESAERVPLLTNDNVEYGKYITDGGVIDDATNEYGLAKIYVKVAGFYHIKVTNSNHPSLGITTDKYDTVPGTILGVGAYDVILYLKVGYYALCWNNRKSNILKSNVFSVENEDVIFEPLFDVNKSKKDLLLKSGFFDNLINLDNTEASKYIADNTGIITDADYDYRLSKIQIKYAGKYWVRLASNSMHPVIWEYDSTYQTPIREVVGKVPGNLDTVIELTPGYYAICFTVSNSSSLYISIDLSNTFVYRIGDLIHTIQDNIVLPESSNRINFSSLGNDDLTISGSSTRSNGVITLTAGIANRAYLAGGLHCYHWDMSAKFKCTGGVSFIIGKDSSTFGAWIELLIDNGVSKYVFHNNGEGNQNSQTYDGELGFDLHEGEEYVIRLFFNVTTVKILGFEIFGQFNEYFTYTFSNVECHGYGSPFFYSRVSCVVKSSSISVQNYYDIKNAKIGVWGHSYVEGDSLGANRDLSFTSLLAEAIGPTKVFNFGLGGDNWQGVYDKMSNEMGFVSNIQYALICCGANDLGLTLSQAQEKINQIANRLTQNHITPIFFTISPTGTNSWYKQNWVDTNAWIRANFKYVDMEQVFLDVDATGEWGEINVRKNLLMGDNVHPNIQGHAEIFKRIQMDCPYLF